MEKEISDLTQLDENEIADMIYEKIDAFWGKFPNIHDYVTKHDMATDVALDLYRPRKDSGIPNILYYYNTKGDRSLKPLIGLVTYNCLMHAARYIHSTGIYAKAKNRHNVMSPVSLKTPIKDKENELTLEDTIADEAVNISKEIDYIMLFDSLPDKIINGVYYKVDNKYLAVSYKTLLNDILSGYNLTQIGDKLYKVNKQGTLCKFRDINEVVKRMKMDLREFLATEYNYSREDYISGCNIL